MTTLAIFPTKHVQKRHQETITPEGLQILKDSYWSTEVDWAF